MGKDRAVLILKMMANPIRLGILNVLAKEGNGICVGGIEEILDIPQSSVSQHLAHLRNSGILACEKKGKKVCYKIVEDGVEKVLAGLDLDEN